MQKAFPGKGSDESVKQTGKMIVRIKIWEKLVQRTPQFHQYCRNEIQIGLIISVQSRHFKGVKRVKKGWKSCKQEITSGGTAT